MRNEYSANQALKATNSNGYNKPARKPITAGALANLTALDGIKIMVAITAFIIVTHSIMGA